MSCIDKSEKDVHLFVKLAYFKTRTNKPNTDNIVVEQHSDYLCTRNNPRSGHRNIVSSTYHITEEARRATTLNTTESWDSFGSTKCDSMCQRLM